MKHLKFLSLYVALAITCLSPPLGWAYEAFQEQANVDNSLAWEEIVSFAQENLPLEGTLMIKSDGFAYIKVADDYIHTLFPMLGLEEEGYKKPAYFRSQEAAGAHISVFYETENIQPEEIGQNFSFELKKIVIVGHPKKARFAVLQVESPELETLRAKYGLSPKLFGHEYHISLAKKNAPRA